MITVDFSRLNLPAGARILDIGCGSGRHAAEAARIPDALVVGSDLCRADLFEAEKRLRFHQDLGETGGGAWLLTEANITALPFPDAFFDLVICSEVLEHIPDHDLAVREMTRILKPNRNLVVSVPRENPERICWALSEDYYNSNGGHIRIYREKRLVSLLEQAGTKLWARHYAHGLHSPYWWLKCLTGPARPEKGLVGLYHRLLVWDMMAKPRLTRVLEKLLNPLIGKSLVLYLRKN